MQSQESHSANVCTICDPASFGMTKYWPLLSGYCNACCSKVLYPFLNVQTSVPSTVCGLQVGCCIDQRTKAVLTAEQRADVFGDKKEHPRRSPSGYRATQIRLFPPWLQTVAAYPA